MTKLTNKTSFADVVTNENILTHITLFLIVFLLGLADFADMSNVKLSWDKLENFNFWKTLTVRLVATTVVRQLYMTYGVRKRKEDSESYLSEIDQIQEGRLEIEKNKWLDHFKFYVEEEVDLYEKLDDYEEMITAEISRLQKPMYKWWKKKETKFDHITELSKDRVMLREYRTELLRGSIKPNDKVEKIKFDPNSISISGRNKITPDIIFDGLRTEGIGNRVGAGYDETRDIIKKNASSGIKAVIQTVFITVAFDGMFLTTGDLSNKLMNLGATIFLILLSLTTSIIGSGAVYKKSFSSASTRNRYIKAFLGRPIKEKPKEVVQVEKATEPIEKPVDNIAKENVQTKPQIPAADQEAQPVQKKMEVIAL